MKWLYQCKEKAVRIQVMDSSLILLRFSEVLIYPSSFLFHDPLSIETCSPPVPSAERTGLKMVLGGPRMAVWLANAN